MNNKIQTTIDKYLARIRPALKLSLCTLPLMYVAAGSNAVEPESLRRSVYDGQKVYYDVQEYQSISFQLDRYVGGVVKISYNHTNAPADVSVEQVTAILQTSFAMIEGLADIHFEFLGETTTSTVNDVDDISDVTWFTEQPTAEGFVLAQAGSGYTQDFELTDRLGYDPYLSGSLEFNTIAGLPTVSTTVHELLHLLGLSHSENPVSIMRPEASRFDLPQADDIAALQALYGMPDILKIPSREIKLDTVSASSVSLDLAQSRLLFFPDGGDNSSGLSSLEGPFTKGSLFLDLALQAANQNEDIIFDIYTTDPNGHITHDTTTITKGFTFLGQDIERSSIMTEIPGDWVITIGNGGRQLAVFTVPVTMPPEKAYNRNPTGSLALTKAENNQITLSITASDSEEDTLGYKFTIPGRGEVSSEQGSLTITPNGPNPELAFAYASDNGLKRDGTPGSNPFGVLLSRYIVLPAEENIPTYYVQEKILHLPSLSAAGLTVSANFKLTALPGAIFKLVEFDVLSNFSGGAGATFDLQTGLLNMPRIIVSDNGQLIEATNIDLQFEADSQPSRFSVKL